MCKSLFFFLKSKNKQQKKRVKLTPPPHPIPEEQNSRISPPTPLPGIGRGKGVSKAAIPHPPFLPGAGRSRLRGRRGECANEVGASRSHACARPGKGPQCSMGTWGRTGEGGRCVYGWGGVGGSTTLLPLQPPYSFLPSFLPSRDLLSSVRVCRGEKQPLLGEQRGTGEGGGNSGTAGRGSTLRGSSQIMPPPAKPRLRGRKRGKEGGTPGWNRLPSIHPSGTLRCR